MSFTIRESGFLLARIEEQLADNNAGLISAADVRNNIGDAVRSINTIVASGDTDGTFPFFNDVRAKHTIPLSGPAFGGRFIAESGVFFSNAPDTNKFQTRPWLGANNIQHNELAGLTIGDPHTQYVSISGHRPMQGNLRMASYWIGAGGQDDNGFKFQYHPTGTTILTSGTMHFPDNSKLGSAIGVAKAFANFDGTNAAIRYGYNVHSVSKVAGANGQYVIQLSSGVVGSGYTVLSQSTARENASSAADFDRNTSCSVIRSGINPSNGRVSFTINTLNENGETVNGKLVDFVVFGSGL